MTATSVSGFEAMGKPIPMHRMTAGLHLIREMCPEWDNSKAMSIVGKVAGQLERDEPYTAMDLSMKEGLDLTGTYRLFAYLLCDQS